MEYKYTKDGKKVVVIGQLNNQETIVQEIFVVNGCEVPGGENFVAKGLLDNPGISWKEENTNKIEAKYKKLSDDFDKKEKSLRDKERTILTALSYKIDSLKAMTNKFSIDAFDMVSKLLKGEYKFIIKGEYSPKIEPFTVEDTMRDDDFYSVVRCEGIKLITLYGRADGDFQFMLNRYRDGSGSNESVYLFTTIEEAKVKLLELVNNNGYYDSRDLESLKQWEILPDAEMLKIYNTKRLSSAEMKVSEFKEKLEEAENKLKEIALQ